MIYRRPTDFETSTRLMQALTHADVSGKAAVLRDGVASLFTMKWPERALAPLYKANAVVAMVTHSLVPTLQELVLERDALTRLCAATSEKQWTSRQAEYESLRELLVKSCETSRKRDTSERFASMRDSMAEYAVDSNVQAAIAMLFAVHGGARTALRLMTSRITESLDTDSDIVTSTDLPAEVMWM